MNDNFSDTALLIQYLDGELTGEELELTRERISKSDDLRKELEKLRLARATVKLYGQTQKVSAIHKEMMAELKKEQPASPPKIFTLFRSVIYVAASVILIVGAIGFYQYWQLSPDNIYNGNYHAYTPGKSRSITNEPTVENELKANRPDRAIELFTAILKPSVPDYFYVGNAQLQKGNASAAVQSFLQVLQKNAQDKTQFFEDDTEYYLAMAYLKNNQLSQAIPLFEKIHADQNHLYHDKVNKWFMWKLHWLETKAMRVR